MLRGIHLLELTPEAEDFAKLLVSERVMPLPSGAGDALHVAMATIHRIEYILTWNVKHLANSNKRTHFAVICMRLGLTPPMIVTPDMLQESDDGC